MKHLSQKQWLRHIRIIKKRELHARKIRPFNGKQRQHSSTPNENIITNPIYKEFNNLQSAHPNVEIKMEQKQITVFAPETMRLKTHKEEVFGFLKCVRSLTKINNVKKIVEFSTIKSLSTICAMLLTVEMHRWQITVGRKLEVFSIEKWNSDVRKLLSNIGLFKIVKLTNPPKNDTMDVDEKFIPIISETKADVDQARQYIEDELVEQNIKLDNSIYTGMIEATTNVIHWAYKDYKFSENREKEIINNRWWLCASFNVKTNKMTIIVYDHGQGIPATLRKSKKHSWIFDWIRRTKGDRKDDAMLLETIMNLPESASGKEASATKNWNRGKGLREMKGLLNNFIEGKLRILSSKGEYEIKCGEKNGSASLSKDSINGTLVAWEFIINPKETKNV